jgi:hypothetical protein
LEEHIASMFRVGEEDGRSMLLQSSEHPITVLSLFGNKTLRGTGLQALRQAFERNLVSLTQCFSSQGGHYAQELARVHFEVLKHLTYSPDLTPWNYCLFPDHKKRLKGRKFSSTEETTLAMDGWFAAQAE